MESWGLHNVVNATPKSAAPHVMAETNAVLRELVELIEDYAPMWYTEDLHNRVAAALGDLQPAI